MDCLFVNTPSYVLNPAPVQGIPTLIGILDKHNYSSKLIDLNVDFMNKLLDGLYLHEFIKLVDNLYYQQSSYSIPSSINPIINSLKNKWINSKKQLNLFDKNRKIIKSILTDEVYFYNPILLSYVLDILIHSFMNFSIFDAAFLENLIPGVGRYRSDYDNPQYSINFDILIEYIQSDLVYLKKYYNDVVSDIIRQKPKCIAISVSVVSQLVPSLLLAYILKKETNIHINFGGTFFSMSQNQILNIDGFFTEFCDSISIDENTNTIVQLLDKLNGNDNVTINNIIFKSNDSINVSKKTNDTDLVNLPYVSFNGIENIKYLSPMLCLPVFASEGCYWSKCIFCMCSNSQKKFKLKPVEKFVDEIEYLSKKYNTSIFYLWDNALPPNYLSKFADLIIQKKIHISFSMYSRLEKEFDLSLLKKLHKAGCVEIYWGMESSNQRVLNYINKGMDVNVSKKVLIDTYNASISSKIYYILGLPTETEKEMQDDLLFTKKLQRYVTKFFVLGECLFMSDSIMSSNRSKYRSEILINEEQKQLITKQIDKYQITQLDNILLYNVYYILYLHKFGFKKVKVLFKISDIILKNKLIFKLYIYIFKFIFNILKYKS